MDDRPYNCKNCGQRLGCCTDDGRLVTDTLVIEFGVFTCRQCGHRRDWQEARESVDDKLNDLISKTLRLRGRVLVIDKAAKIG